MRKLRMGGRLLSGIVYAANKDLDALGIAQSMKTEDEGNHIP
jgi:hypothetical protein